MSSARDIRLIAIDLDGTLLRDDKTIAPRVRDAVLRAAAQGIRIVLASARPPRTVRAFYRELQLDTPQVNYNGALIWDEPGQSVVDHRPMASAIASELIAQVRHIEANVLVSCEILDRWHTDRTDNRFMTASAWLFPPDVIAPLQEFGHHDVTKLMLQGPPAMMDRLADRLRHPQVKLARTDPDLLQYMSVDAGKGLGLKRLCERLDVPLAHAMAIGDNENDIEMLQVAGLGVAMGHASAAVKAAAQLVVASNMHDGVAEAINICLAR
ncbi:MAG: Cof-type HAD-IIB family hydrolase [Tepidisphaeraceae bacterium]